MPAFIASNIAKRLEYPIFLAEAMEHARRSMCLTRRVGAVVVNQNGVIIGRGANMPPDVSQPNVCNKTCIPKVGGPNDRHCCLHAEQLALWSVVMPPNPRPISEIYNSTLIFADIPEDLTLNIVPAASKPYCTQCSKLALYLGVQYWVCYHKAGVWPEGEGFYRYTAQEYNTLSFQYREPSIHQIEGIVDIDGKDGCIDDRLNDLVDELEGKRVRITVEEVK